jgi:DNA primase
VNSRHGADSDFIEKVKQASNIVTVANRYMVLRAKGKTHWACCPFHHEKTPSFAINELQQYYHCFGCGVSGDVIGLVQHMERLDFYGTLEFLAKAAGLAMPATRDPEYEKKKQKKQRILQTLEAARKYYCANLGGVNLEYLHNRGITDELIKTFNIGASTSWDGVIKHLKQKSFTEQEMIDAGIAGRGEKGNIYDAMGNRITFAIFNLNYECVGFTGRTLSRETDIAKYKNTAQTIVFDKGNIVYGADVLKKNKLTNFVDQLIVVEGNMDVISLVGAGFTNTVACMGTSMTVSHAHILKRFTDRIYICLDGDIAGQRATSRGLNIVVPDWEKAQSLNIDVLVEEFLDVRVIQFPDGLDPDDFIKKRGAKAFGELLDTALPLIDYKLEHIKKQNPLKDSIDKTKYLKAVAEVLKPIAASAELELYIPKIAETAGVSFDAVKKAVGGGSPAVSVHVVPAERKDTAELTTKYGKALHFVVASVLHNKTYVNFDDLNGLEIENFLYKTAIEKVKQKSNWTVGCVFTEFKEPEAANLDKFVNYEFEDGDGAEKWKDCIKTLSAANIQKQIDELKEKYKRTDDTSEKEQIMGEIQKLAKRKKS